MVDLLERLPAGAGRERAVPALAVAPYQVERRDGPVIQSAPPAAVGLGSRRPVASNATSAGRQQNRRVEIVVQPKQ